MNSLSFIKYFELPSLTVISNAYQNVTTKFIFKSILYTYIGANIISLAVFLQSSYKTMKADKSS